jgi:hypothetical protein
MITRTVTAALASATLATLPAAAQEASDSGQDAAPERTEMQERYLETWSDRMDDLSDIASEEADEASDAAAEAFDTLGDRWADLKDATEEEWAEAQAAFQRAYNDYLAAETGDGDSMGSDDGSTES